MINVLIGDDHRIVREGLKQVLSDAPEVCIVGEARTGPEVVEKVRSLSDVNSLDLVLLDIALPGQDGLEVLQILRQEYPHLPILMLSTYPEKQYAVRCIRLGAAGYLNKSADPDDMQLWEEQQQDLVRMQRRTGWMWMPYPTENIKFFECLQRVKQ
jgi:two-component system invasion response regulator UvrY